MFASRFVLAAALCAALATAASAQSTLRVGLAEDPDGAATAAGTNGVT